jgi:hypothetical protein
MTAHEQSLAALARVRSFIEYARYELQDGPLVLGMQFPTKDCADKVLARLDAVLLALAEGQATCKDSLPVADDHTEDTRAMVEAQATCGTCRWWRAWRAAPGHGQCLHTTSWAYQTSTRTDWGCADHQPTEAK